MFKTIFNIFLALLCIFSLVGCVGGLLASENYKEFIAGITGIYGDESIFYDLDILIDEIDFNEDILNKPYKKLEIKHKTDFKVLGVSFAVKSENNCILTFKLFINDEEISKTKKSIESNAVNDVDLFLEHWHYVPKNANIYIAIDEELKNEQQEKSGFIFDNLLIFFEE